MRKLTQNSLVGALLATSLLTLVFTLSASAAAPLKITSCYSAASRPKTIVLTCADANTALKGLAWSSFGGSTAQGKGTFVTNNCEPNCASGKNISYPVKLKATGSVSCKHGLRVYGKLTLQFTGKAPGPAVPRTWKLGCPVS